MDASLPKIPKRTPVRVVMTFVGGVVAFALFGAGIWLLVRSYSNVPTVEQQRARVRLDYKQDVSVENQRLLETYGWRDRDKGIAHIPIDEAMQRVVGEYEDRGTVASDVPVPGTKAAEEAAAALLGGGADGAAADGGSGTDDAGASGGNPTDGGDPSGDAAANDGADAANPDAPGDEAATVTSDVNPEALIPRDEPADNQGGSQ